MLANQDHLYLMCVVFQINIFLDPMKLVKLIIKINQNAICLTKYSDTVLLVLRSDLVIKGMSIAVYSRGRFQPDVAFR